MQRSSRDVLVCEDWGLNQGGRCIASVNTIGSIYSQHESLTNLCTEYRSNDCNQLLTQHWHSLVLFIALLLCLLTLWWILLVISAHQSWHVALMIEGDDWSYLMTLTLLFYDIPWSFKQSQLIHVNHMRLSTYSTTFSQSCEGSQTCHNKQCTCF